jgi:hypothetical protein
MVIGSVAPAHLAVRCSRGLAYCPLLDRSTDEKAGLRIVPNHPSHFFSKRWGRNQLVKRPHGHGLKYVLLLKTEKISLSLGRDGNVSDSVQAIGDDTLHHDGVSSDSTITQSAK